MWNESRKKPFNIYNRVFVLVLADGFGTSTLATSFVGVGWLERLCQQMQTVLKHRLPLKECYPAHILAMIKLLFGRNDSFVITPLK